MRLVTGLLLTIFLAALCASPAFAGETAEAEGGGADALMNVDILTAIISIVVFLILLLVLSKTAWKPILGALKQREETIAKALDDAKAANEKAQETIRLYEAKLQTAKDEALEIADEARKDAAEIRARLQADAKAEADDIVARAKRDIEQQTAKAWDLIVRDAAGVATEAAQRIIGKELTDEGHAALVADVVSQFARTSGGGA